MYWNCPLTTNSWMAIMIWHGTSNKVLNSLVWTCHLNITSSNYIFINILLIFQRGVYYHTWHCCQFLICQSNTQYSDNLFHLTVIEIDVMLNLYNFHAVWSMHAKYLRSCPISSLSCSHMWLHTIVFRRCLLLCTHKHLCLHSWMEIHMVSPLLHFHRKWMFYKAQEMLSVVLWGRKLLLM